MIEFFNNLVKEFKDDIDLDTQVRAAYSAYGMTMVIHYLLDDEKSPVAQLMDGLVKLGKNPSVLSSLKCTRCVVLDCDDYKLGDASYQIFMGDASEKDLTMHVAAYGDLLFIVLPHWKFWSDCGLSWLSSSCRHCGLGPDHPMPWMRGACQCADTGTVN